MTISVMITTRNRRADLSDTCHRLTVMRPPPGEVLICADGCSDGTAEMVRGEFPGFKLVENVTSLGSVGSRDLLLRSAQGDIVVSLDDDSYPLADDFFSRLPVLFSEHSEADVICFPELRDGGKYSDMSQTAVSTGRYVPAYANCAAAMRREAYLRRPGFPAFFKHMYEEPDYALQCYAAGRAVWFEPSMVVRHHRSSVGRVPLIHHQQHSRNELWSVWMRCPWPWLPVVSAFRVVRQFQHACSQGIAWVIQEPVWWFQAVCGIGKCIGARDPIPWKLYYGWMGLTRRRVTSIEGLPFAEMQSKLG
jgi:GT2 family glycosyltransferase